MDIYLASLKDGSRLLFSVFCSVVKTSTLKTKDKSFKSKSFFLGWMVCAVNPIVFLHDNNNLIGFWESHPKEIGVKEKKNNLMTQKIPNK